MDPADLLGKHLTFLDIGSLILFVGKSALWRIVAAVGRLKGIVPAIQSLREFTGKTRLLRREVVRPERDRPSAERTCQRGPNDKESRHKVDDEGYGGRSASFRLV